LELEAEEIRRIIVISITMNIFVNGGILFIEAWIMLKFGNTLLMPLDQFSSFREIQDYLINRQEKDIYVKYGLPLLLIFLNFIFFIIPYALGEEWVSALLNSVLAILPFQVAFLTVHIVRVFIEIILLILRQVFHRLRF
jgi:hypothetical protein